MEDTRLKRDSMVSGFGVDGMRAGASGGVLYEASRWFGLSQMASSLTMTTL